MQNNNFVKNGKFSLKRVSVAVLLAVVCAFTAFSAACFIAETKGNNDVVAIKTINSVLAEDEAVNGKPVLFRDVLTMLSAKGYIMENLTPCVSGDYLWDSVSNRFALYNGTEGYFVYRDGATSKDEADYWTIAAKTADLEKPYNKYLKKGDFGSELTVSCGLDAGENVIDVINYVGGETAKNAVIYSDGLNTVINVTASANDSVAHYGLAKEVNVNGAQYSENGITAFITLGNGKLILEDGASVSAAYIPDVSKNYDIAVNGGKLSAAYANKPADAANANARITDETVNVLPLTDDTEATDETVSALLDGKKTEACSAALDEAAEGGKVEVDGVARIKGKGFDTLEEALLAAEDGNTVVMLRNCRPNKQLVVDKSIVLDLNGKAIEFAQMKTAIIVNADVTLTVNDSTGKGYIKAVGNTEGGYSDYSSAITLAERSGSGETSFGGSLVLNGGEIVHVACGDRSAVIFANSKNLVDINGGKVTSRSDGSYGLAIKSAYDAELNIDNAVVSNYAKEGSGSIINCFGTIAVNNSEFNGYLVLDKGEVNNSVINGKLGTSTSTSCNITIKNCLINGDFKVGTSLSQRGKLVDCTVEGDVYSYANCISGGKYKNIFDVSWLEEGKTLSANPDEDGYYTVIDSADENAVATLTYEGAAQPVYYRSLIEAINAGKAADAASAVVTVIKDAYAVSSVYSHNVNKVVVNEGVTLTLATGMSYSTRTVEESRCTFENNGTVISKNQIYDNKSYGCGYIVNNGTMITASLQAAKGGFVNNGSLILTGGEGFKSYFSSPIQNNGTITGEGDEVLLTITDDATFTGSGAAIAPNEYIWSETDKAFVRAQAAIYNVNKDRSFSDWKDAVKYSSAGDVLRVEKDFELVHVDVNKKLTIDLNGHLLSYGNSVSGNGTVTVAENGDLTVKDSTVSAAPVLNADGTVTYASGMIRSTFGAPAVMVKTGGKFTLESGRIQAEANNFAIGIFDNADPSKKLGASNASVTINGGLVINTSTDRVGYAIVVYGPATASSAFGSYAESDPVLNVNGGLIWANQGSAISGQGSLNNTVINISGGTVYSEEGSAIYHPQYGKLNISGTALVKGKTAVAFKGGELTVSGGTLEATREDLFIPDKTTSSGTAITGDALYIDDGYNRGIVVVINGGTFKVKASGAQEYRVLFSGSNPASVTDNR